MSCLIYSDEVVKAEAKLYLEGKSMRDLAAITGCCLSTIHHHLAHRLKDISYKEYVQVEVVRHLNCTQWVKEQRNANKMQTLRVIQHEDEDVLARRPDCNDHVL